jgi:lipopolysaccharide export system permease protein
MHTLDRYVATRYLRALGFALLVFLTIYLVVDLVEHLDEFIDARAETAQVLRYYLHYIPFIIVATLPVSMLLATLFSVGALSKYNELVAMRASGVSLLRMATPLLVIGAVMSLLSLVFTEMVVPRSNQIRWEIKRYEIQKKERDPKTISYHLYRQGNQGRVFRFERYDIRNRTGYGVLVQGKEGPYVRWAVRADQMQWSDSQWTLSSGELRVFHQADSVSVMPFDSLTRPDWSDTPALFAQREKEPENMGYFELARRVKVKEASGADATPERVGLQLKIAYPFSCFMMVLLGVPIASTPKRAGFAKSFGIAVGIGFLYITFTDVMQSLGKAGDVSPYVAAWTMNALFLVVGLLMFAFTRK